ncbi:hypothetical protein [Gilvimarinus xylanilyticus]|uniref:Uncharacterized protein n=1 Tax=Gilvimarinus xylanilyticus TaxID=2944139 RepID=A0A9X2I4Y1_9GAMM|nr:hypothetical protein [Gilvimarinus xylanilyticus]MCP8899527.1 hypothetical protein [Gilvimarinus xylanilyticus]
MSQRRDREALLAPKGAAKTSIRCVAYTDVGKGREQDAEGLHFLPRAMAIAYEARQGQWIARMPERQEHFPAKE